MLCKCSGKYIDIYFILKITFCYANLLPTDPGTEEVAEWGEGWSQRG